MTIQWKLNQQTEKHSTPCRPVLTRALNLQIQPDRLRWREQSHTSSSTRSPDPVDLRCLELKNWTSTKIRHVSFVFFLMDAILGLQNSEKNKWPTFLVFFGHVWEKSQFELMADTLILVVSQDYTPQSQRSSAETGRVVQKLMFLQLTYWFKIMAPWSNILLLLFLAEFAVWQPGWCTTRTVGLEEFCHLVMACGEWPSTAST